MRLMLKTRQGTRVCDWESYALLRDNVQHFLEEGTPRNRFVALHSFEKAIDAEPECIEAARLRGEVLRAWSALWWRNLEDAAISPRTQAILTRSPALPATVPTVAARHASCGLPIRAAAETPIPRAAGRFVHAVLALTTTAEDGDLIEVRRLGDAPNFARSARSSS